MSYKFYMKVQSNIRVTVDLEDAFNNFRNLGKLSSFGDEILWSDGTSWRRKGNNYFLFINNDDDLFEKF